MTSDCGFGISNNGFVRFTELVEGIGGLMETRVLPSIVSFSPHSIPRLPR